MKLTELKSGDIVTLDAGFTCMTPGPQTVAQDQNGLYVECEHGHHYLDGQEGFDGHLVGVLKS